MAIHTLRCMWGTSVGCACKSIFVQFDHHTPSGMTEQQMPWVEAAKMNGLMINLLILMTMGMGGIDNITDG
jgi:hypothetical protein